MAPTENRCPLRTRSLVPEAESTRPHRRSVFSVQMCSGTTHLHGKQRSRCGRRGVGGAVWAARCGRRGVGGAVW